jgi:hypothetical protein
LSDFFVDQVDPIEKAAIAYNQKKRSVFRDMSELGTGDRSAERGASQWKTVTTIQ